MNEAWVKGHEPFVDALVSSHVARSLSSASQITVSLLLRINNI